jgi:hypothetical protein
MLQSVAQALAWLLALLHTRIVVPLVGWWEGWTQHAEESTKAFIRWGRVFGADTARPQLQHPPDRSDRSHQAGGLLPSFSHAHAPRTPPTPSPPPRRRESFGLFNRALNGAGAGLLSALDASYSETQRRAFQQQQAWQSWWREDRTSTLNALVANVQHRPGAR